MTVLFQDKIIYMSYMPPFTRSEKMDDYRAICRPVEWKELPIKSLDGTRIMIAVAKFNRPNPQLEPEPSSKRSRRVVLCYFHGNGGSIPPRMPLLSNTLKEIEACAATVPGAAVEFVLIALSYRGYWTSSGRASQKGIEKDAAALLNHVASTYSSPDVDLEVVLWGQSIGAGVAATAAANYLQTRHSLQITGLILETPFTSVKSMLLALYPQRWLPYKYLHPFLLSHWDSGIALTRVAESGVRPMVLIMPATRDEVVPPVEADKLEAISRKVGLPTVRRDIIGALHTEATSRKDGQKAIADFVIHVANLR
jgi:pimeloyl-ACP methyl ester carboxylesterase